MKKHKNGFPNSRIEKLIYRRSSGLPLWNPEHTELTERDVLRITATRDGIVAVERSGGNVEPTICITRRIAPKKTRKLFRQLRRCLTDKNNKMITIYDTTAHSAIMFFSDGTQYCIYGVFGRPGAFTRTYVRRFLEECARSGKFGTMLDNIRV